MLATTHLKERPSRRFVRAIMALATLAAIVTALTIWNMNREGYFFRGLNPSHWLLRLQGRYGYDAKEGVFRQGRSPSRLVALTFDDGPHESTPDLLDVLKRYNAHATFFLVGSNVVKRPEYARRMLANGNELGNHTRSHFRLPELRGDQVRAELNNDNIVIARATGYRVRLFRPPGGQYDDRVTAEAKREGMLTVLWSNNTGDWQAKDPQWIARRVLSDLQPGDVLLLHEDNPQTIAAMPLILEGLRARGYRAVTVSALLKDSGIEPPAIEVHPAVTKRPLD